MRSKRYLQPLSSHWYELHAGYWFIPVVLSAMPVCVAFAALVLDAKLDYSGQAAGSWLVMNGSEASAVLQTITASTVTVSGVVLSITIVTLTLASSQYGPRVLRTFMVDLGTQLVIGTFAAIFVYVVIIQRAVHSDQSVAEVPQIAVAIASVSAVVVMAALICFVHHVAVQIQPSHLAKLIGLDLDAAIDSMFPEQDLKAMASLSATALDESSRRHRDEALTILSQQDGYIDVIQAATLFELAVRLDAVLQLKVRPGDLVYRGDIQAYLWPETPPTADAEKQIRSAFRISDRRTPAQDLECSINELSAVAVKALSPSIKDPTTAVTCIDRLGASLTKMVARAKPPRYVYDSDKRLRMILRPFSVGSAIDSAFNEIRQYGAQSVSVQIRLLETIERVALRTIRANDLKTLMRHADMAARCIEGFREPHDQKAGLERYKHCRRVIRGVRRQLQQEHLQQRRLPLDTLADFHDSVGDL